MRRLFTVGSIVIHATIIVAILVAQLVAVGPLPVPRSTVTFDGARPVHLIDISPPAPPRRASATTAAPVVSSGAAPLAPPIGIQEETGRENITAPGGAAIVVGVEHGTGAPLGSIGTVEGVDALAVAPPTQPVRLRPGIQAPRKTVDIAPLYPPVARMTRVEGVVILEAVIDIHGAVVSVRVLRPLQFLDQAAVDAVRQWRFTPALLNGEPIPVVMTVTVNFTLRDR